LVREEIRLNKFLRQRVGVKLEAVSEAIYKGKQWLL